MKYNSINVYNLLSFFLPILKEGDTLEVLPVSIHPTDDSYQHGKSGVGFDSASETPGTERPDEEIVSRASFSYFDVCKNR